MLNYTVDNKNGVLIIDGKAEVDDNTKEYMIEIKSTKN